MLESQFLTFMVPIGNRIGLLAQDAVPVEGPAWQQILFNPIGMITILVVLFYVMVLLPERRNRNELTKRLAALKKNDRVVTVGGIHGTIVNITESDQVVIRVDENNNTRLHVNRSAVSRVISDDDDKSVKP
ncbi:preprotein translocase subunit YajC [Rosistilla oblonga]|uniref:preprotein translocase subunit YajC n=2 Tax=Rosistilla oblonga TaxID=2527990 RepID=UPI00118D1FC2|nr:preprotein translocase subunit YajC [Rosistilla oblonga]